jgi:hypothetical protein
MKTIAFLVRQFSERGTEVALFDYAYYNETLLNNRSIILCFLPTFSQGTFNKDCFLKFKTHFTIVFFSDYKQLYNIFQNYTIDVFYTLSCGISDFYLNKFFWGNTKSIQHCVFDTRYNTQFDYSFSISHFLNKKYKTSLCVIPHIVHLPFTEENLRQNLNIPENAVVLGRYGGYNEFNIEFVHQAIAQVVCKNDTYFLFMNTKPFFHHPRIIYLQKNIDVFFKRKFINTCNAMIHARLEGETFGLSVAEFSFCNKPIITCECGDLEHFNILRDKAIKYVSLQDLLGIFKNIKSQLNNHKCWNAYENYNPKNVMSLFPHFTNKKKLI